MPNDVTDVANNAGASPKGGSANELMPLLYEDLRHLAQKYFRDERADHTLQPTALVHEAYLRLIDQTRVTFEGRTHFFAACARTMRRVLVDYARGRLAARRGGGRIDVPVHDEVAAAGLSEEQILILHDAIEKLAALDARQAQVVELRYFGGMSMDEIAANLNVSKRSVEGDWTAAKAWLRAEFASDPA